MIRRHASYLLVVGIALAAAGCGSSRKTVEPNGFGPPVHGSRVATTVPKGVRVGPGPFLFWGGASGSQSGMFGDGGDGPHGTSIGCLNGRRYSDALGIQNSTKAPLRLIAVSGPNPQRRIVDRVAVQLRLSPPYHPSAGLADTSDLVFRRWSAKPTRPVTIPPNRIATVQRNFLLRNCHEIGEGQAIAIPGSLVVRYRRSGRVHQQKLTIPSDRLLVVRGPIKRSCDPVFDSATLLTSDVSCAFARHAAPLCRAMHNGGWLGCTVVGRYWECGRFAGPGFPLLETCYLPHRKSHWFSVVWVGHGLGIWGAIQNRRANLGWSRLDAWPATTGICQVRRDVRTLVFRSSALRLVRGKVVSHARATFFIRNYHGLGTHAASGSTPSGRAPVMVTVTRRDATRVFYLAVRGRLTILRARNGVISGLVYASLLRRGGANRINLNGTWTCRVAH